MLKRFFAAIILAGATAASAATIVINHTMDLTTAGVGAAGVSRLEPLQGGPVTISLGDTVVFTLDFTGDQSLRLTNPDKLFAQPLNFGGPGIGGVNGHDGSMELFDLTGPARTVTSFPTYNSCCLHAGPFPLPADFMTGSGTIEFSGLRMTFTIDTLNGASSTILNTMYLWSNYSNGEVGSAGGPAHFGADVPEPALTGLLGLGALALAVRRRRARAAA